MQLGLGPRAQIVWLRPDGRPMVPVDWRPDRGHALAARIAAPGGELLALLNGGEGEVLFQLPAPAPGRRWRRRLSTAEPDARESSPRLPALRLLPHSLVLLDQESSA